MRGQAPVVERHLRDLERQGDPDFPYRFDPAREQRFCAFASYVNLAEGAPFVLHPFQRFIAGSLFGWVDAHGHRRFRTAYIEMGKGNGKTPLAALVGYITGLGDAVVGVDVPFGLPEPLIGAADWLDFIGTFAERWPDPASFRAGCRAAAGGRELRRRCDAEARTPFCPYNLRLQRQTWHAVAGVRAPLVLDGRAAAAPMQTAVRGKPILLEACPASFLKNRADGLYKPYKGKTSAHRKQRRVILAALIESNLLYPPSDALRRRVRPHRRRR